MRIRARRPERRVSACSTTSAFLPASQGYWEAIYSLPRIVRFVKSVCAPERLTTAIGNQVPLTDVPKPITGPHHQPQLHPFYPPVQGIVVDGMVQG